MTKVPEKLPKRLVSRVADDTLGNLREVLNTEDVRVIRMYGVTGDTLKDGSVRKKRAAGGTADNIPHRTSVVTKGSLKVTARAADDTILYQEVRGVGDLKSSSGTPGEAQITFEPQDDDTQWHCVMTYGLDGHASTYGEANVGKRIHLPKTTNTVLLVLFEGRIRVSGVEYDAPIGVRVDPEDDPKAVVAVTPAQYLLIEATVDVEASPKGKKK